MIKQAKLIRRIVNLWTKAPAKSFQEFKNKEVEDIVNMIQPKNFDTPEKAMNTLYKMWAKKLAFEEILEQKKLADDYDLKAIKNR